MSRAGRKRKAGPREPNGRLRREDVRETALEARARHFGVTRATAQAAMPASTVLALFLAKQSISQRQYDAGLTIERVTRAWEQAIGARGHGLPGVLDRIGGDSGDESEAEVRRFRLARDEYERLLDAYRRADAKDWRCRTVTVQVVVYDQLLPDHLVPLRLCLDEIAAEFGVPGEVGVDTPAKSPQNVTNPS